MLAMRNVNMLDCRLEANIRHGTESRSFSRLRLGDRIAVGQAMGALHILPRLDEASSAISSISGMCDNSCELMEEIVPVGFNAAVFLRHVLVVHGNDSVLGNILHHSRLRVRVGYIGILLVVVPPVVAIRQGRHAVCAVEVEGVADFVNHGREHVFDRSDKGDVAVPFKCPAAVRGDIDDVADPLAHLDGHLAKLAGHGVYGAIGGSMVAEDPRIAALFGC